MSCRLRRLRPCEVYLMFVETLIRYNQHSRPIEVKGSLVLRVARRCCAQVIEARKASVLWAQRDKHVRIRWPPCAVKTASEKKARLMQKRGTTLACIFCYVCFLISCIYARVLCILACCFDGVSLLLLAKSFPKSHCTMERRQDGLRANRGRNKGQRGRNCWVRVASSTWNVLRFWKINKRRFQLLLKASQERDLEICWRIHERILEHHKSSHRTDWSSRE